MRRRRPHHLGAVWRTPRSLRLETDLLEMYRLKNESTILDFRAYGDPPDRYEIVFMGTTLVQHRLSTEPQALVMTLGSQYPLQRPEVRWITPITHPNISSAGSICFGNFGRLWTPLMKLTEFVEVLWDYARMAIVNWEGKFPPSSATELDRRYGLPLDKRPLRDRVYDPDGRSSIIRSDPANRDDIIFMDDDEGECAPPQSS